MATKSHEEKSSTYQGIPDAQANAIRALLQTLPHVDEERINLVFRILEEGEDKDIIRKLRVLDELDERAEDSAVGIDDTCLSLKGLCKELGVDRATMWRRFKENPGLKKRLMSGYAGGGRPKYSLAKVRKFKAGTLN